MFLCIFNLPTMHEMLTQSLIKVSKAHTICKYSLQDRKPHHCKHLFKHITSPTNTLYLAHRCGSTTSFRVYVSSIPFFSIECTQRLEPDVVTCGLKCSCPHWPSLGTYSLGAFACCFYNLATEGIRSDFDSWHLQ